MCCWNATVTASLEVGFDHVFSSVGAAEPPTSANGPPAFACSACGSENEPLTRWPVAVLDGSATLNAASPPVEITFADVWAKESLPGPAVNAPNDAAGPSVSDSVAGTVPPTSPVGASGTSNACTVLLGVSNEISAELPVESFAYAATSSGIEMVRLPAVTATFTSRTTRPLMSGDHGGMPPSVNAHADSP